MTEEAFIQKNKNNWDKLAAYNMLLSKKNIGRLPTEDISEFTELFRITGHHLAFARTHFAESNTTAYLNGLVGCAHNYFYTREKMRLSTVLHYFRCSFPRQVRQEWRFFWVSLTAFALSGVFVYLLCSLDPALLGFFMQGELSEPNGGIPGWTFPALSSFIITNNIRVTAMAFAFGFLAGAGTLYILLINGGLIGAYVYAAASSGLSMAVFWSLILPHGFIELIAIFISGAAGLMIGRGILTPGRLLRKDAVIKEAKRAVCLMPGIAFMLIVAGLIEGFFTPLEIAYGWKFALAFITLIFTVLYLTFSGRKKSLSSG